MTFNKEEYWERRKKGLRGQVDNTPEPKLAKDENGNDRISGVYLVEVPDSRVKGGKRVLAMNRRERRSMVKNK